MMGKDKILMMGEDSKVVYKNSIIEIITDLTTLTTLMH
jgi:hypothetical protein